MPNKRCIRLYGNDDIRFSRGLHIIFCNSLVAGGGSPTIDLGAAVGGSNLNLRGWSGGITFNNILAGDAVSLEGTGGTITVNGTGGSINVRGIFDSLVDNSSAAVTIDETAMLDRKSLAGYAESSVWISTFLSNTSTLDYVDGTVDNPVSTIAAATTIAASLGYRSFRSTRGSSYTLAQTYTGYTFSADLGSIALGNQDVGGSLFVNALLSGIATGSSQIIYVSCKLTNVTTSAAAISNSSISGTLTIGTGNYVLNNCSDSPDAGTAIIDFGSSTGTTSLDVHDWQGNLQLDNMGQLGTDTAVISMSGPELTISANCTGGTVTVVGATTINDLSGGAVTINTEAVVATGDNLEARTPTAAQLAYIVANAATGLPVTFTTSGGSTTAAVLNQVDGASASATNDQYNGRLLVFTDGTLKGVVTDITDYDGSTTTATITAIPTAPTASHNARLI